MRRLPRHHLLACLAYLLVALALTAPILTAPAARFLGGDTSDVYETAHHVWWFKTALQSGADVFWHALLGYPDGFAAVQLWAHPLQFFPMWLFAFFMPLPLAYNLSILLTLTLNGWAMYGLARRRLAGEQHLPAWIAGLVFMIFPAFQGHLFDGHSGLLVQWPVPLLLIFLFDYADFGGRRRFFGALLFCVLAMMGHALQAVYLLMPLLLLFVLARLHQRDFTGALRVAAVGILAMGWLLLFLSPLLGDTLAQYAAAGGTVRYSIDLLGLFSPSFANPFWDGIAAHSVRVLGSNLAEGASYIGLLGGCLALVGLLATRAARWWLLTALVAWVLALGPILKLFDQPITLTIAGYETIVPLPYALLADLPLFEFARTPGRFMFLFALALAMMAGYGMAALWTSPLLLRRRRALRYCLALVIALLLYQDYQFFAEFPQVSAEIPAAVHALAARDDIRAVYNVPHDHLLAAKEAMYLQTAHGKALIAGHDTRQTPVDPAKLTLLSSFHPPLLADAAVDVIILNKPRAAETEMLDALMTQAQERLGAAFYEDERYALFETPAAQAPLEAVYWTAADDGAVTFIYKEQPGWLEYRATLKAQNRRVTLLLNDVPLQTQVISGAANLSLPLPIARRGYNTFRIALDPPCPPHIDTTVLLCHDVTIDVATIELLSRGAIYDPARFEDGIQLAGYHMPADFEDELSIRFWWRFESERSVNDVRFVHVLNAERRLMTQNDSSFGAVPASTERTETVTVELGGLPPGEYWVLAGWYALPDAIRYDVLTNVDGAQDNTIVLGTFTITE